jgi:hypothetical protein
MKVASTSMRTNPRPGMLVLATPQASGIASTPASPAANTPSFSEFSSASM